MCFAFCRSTWIWAGVFWVDPTKIRQSPEPFFILLVNYSQAWWLDMIGRRSWSTRGNSMELSWCWWLSWFCAKFLLLVWISFIAWTMPRYPSLLVKTLFYPLILIVYLFSLMDLSSFRDADVTHSRVYELLIQFAWFFTHMCCSNCHLHCRSYNLLLVGLASLLLSSEAWAA